MTMLKEFYEWLESSPCQWFADEDVPGEIVTVRFVIDDEDEDA